MKLSKILVILIIFFLINIFPWTVQLAQRASGKQRRGLPVDKNGKVQSQQGLNNNTLLGAAGSSRRASTVGLQPPLIISREDTTKTLAQLIKSSNYSINRHHKACERLADNVTVDLEEPFRIGVSREVYGRNATPNETQKPFAYVLMVSNHKYVDGAMVVADSLAEFSEHVKHGRCDLVLMVPEKINPSVLEMLSYVFHRVKIIRSMDVFSEKSYYKTTFDKMYLYFLEEYESVIFFDADSMIVGNPDKLFSKVSAIHPLTAVGGSDYFQTALLILRPSIPLFLDLYIEYRYGSFGYNQWRARDGILFRNCLMETHDNIGHPTNSVFHFYGFIKPWFNKDIPYKHASKGEPLVFDSHYQTWWLRYERLHQSFFVPLALRDRERLGSDYHYGESALIQTRKSKFLPMGVSSFEEVGRVSPVEYMWLQRYSGGSEYLRPTFQKMAMLRDVKKDKEENAFRIVVGEPTAGGGGGSSSALSCDAVCRSVSSVCVAEGLSHSALNDCEYTHPGTLGGTVCVSCTMNFDSPAAPYIKPSTKRSVAAGTKAGFDCFMNFLHDVNTAPSCNATGPSGVRRICACTRGG